MQKGILYLIPASLGVENVQQHLPSHNADILNSLTEFIVEDIRTARRFMRKAGFKGVFDECTFHILNKHTKRNDIPSFINNLKKGKSIGLLSEAGSPCIADPGAIVVSMAHEMHLEVVPLSGPSSILLALMASGFNGQQFAFNGYLPIDKNERIKKLKQLELEIQNKNQTQIFIEAPFRNESLFNDIINNCNKNTKLCVASKLTQPGEFICTLSISEWSSRKPKLHKQPTIFLLYK